MHWSTKNMISHLLYLWSSSEMVDFEILSKNRTASAKQASVDPNDGIPPSVTG